MKVHTKLFLFTLHIAFFMGSSLLFGMVEDDSSHSVSYTQRQPSELPSSLERTPLKISFIRTLEGHQNILAEAFNTAKKKMTLVSPYMTQYAMESDNIPEMMLRTLQRGTHITIYTDSKDVLKHGMLKYKRDVSYVDCIDWRIVDRLHAKILIIDDEKLINGSFNWLSALRNPNSRFANYEVSTLVEGQGTQKAINDILEDLHQLEVETLQTHLTNMTNGYMGFITRQKVLDKDYKPMWGSDIEHQVAAWALIQISKGGIPEGINTGFGGTSYHIYQRNVTSLLRGFLLFLDTVHNQNYRKAFEDELSEPASQEGTLAHAVGVLEKKMQVFKLLK
jgi:PLD-like domain